MGIEERNKILEGILNFLQTSKFQYVKSKGGVTMLSNIPPKEGTQMNCQSAARIFIEMARDKEINGLISKFYKSPDPNGYLVVLSRGELALGCNPEIDTSTIKGWEFDNHWRVLDESTGRFYDPTFGTFDENNPKGLIGIEMTTNPKTFEMSTNYGRKYLIVRKGTVTTCELLTEDLPDNNFLIDANKFVLMGVGSLRQ